MNPARTAPFAARCRLRAALGAVLLALAALPAVDSRAAGTTVLPAPPASAAALPSAVPADELAAQHEVLVMLRLPPAHLRGDGGYAGSYGDAAGRQARRRVALALAREHGLQLLSEWPMDLLGVDCYVMRTPPGHAADEVASALAGDARVEWVQPMQLYRAQGSAAGGDGHADPLYTLQPAAASWQLARLHRVATGREVTVAVIDSGVDAHHPDLEGQVDWARDFVGGGATPPELHGTAVAGIIAAHADNGLGIAGVAPAARLMALRACWQRADASTLCNTLTLAQALQYAIRHDAEVINLSLSGPADRLLDELIGAALARGTVVVSAADRSAPDGGFPASHRGVIAVVDDLPGPAPPGAMKAPGRDVPTTEPGASWGLVSGASFASAHVAGLAALLRELQRPPPALQLVRGGSDRVDPCATLGRAQGRCVCSCTPVTARGPAMAQ